MDLSFIDPILKYVPGIKQPAEPLSFRQKMKWTLLIMGVYFLMFSAPAIGVNSSVINQPLIQLISIVFASRIGSLVTVGIGPIVLASIVLQLVVGAGILKVDLNDPEQKGRFQGLQKIGAMSIAVIEAYIFVATGYVPLASASFFGIVVVQLALAAVLIVFLDEAMTKWGITSGINMFIAGGVAYAIIAGTISILFLAEAVPAIQAGGATAIPNAILAFAPLFFAILIFLISIYAYDMKVELPLVFSQLRGIGGRLPIPFLYVSVLPVILATSFELSLTVWFRFLANVSGSLANLAKFIAYYQVTPSSTGAASLNLVGGLVYLISPTFPLPYSAPYGIGGYGAYFSYLISGTSQLILPWGGVIAVPELVHVLVYTLVLVILAVVFGRFWIEMTGQSPKNVAEQLQDVGWQIPGFRRDPRIVESILNKYIPTITVLGSIFVALLAALATLTGAVGTGMGILLTVGIMYMVYQQLEQQHALDAYPRLNKLLS